ncbi:putative signal transduction histidine-protein kinase [Triangularia verruculosa]|uniref:Signal transduction histidine-protein kinase n=1 Tax=Triangularia verruculosa TaxID=2587418 RepID=A0AAN6XQU6_9PEZI|nr:putative signal transduction histidine-protein kinase [Triangularia verruculosa]
MTLEDRTDHCFPPGFTAVVLDSQIPPVSAPPLEQTPPFASRRDNPGPVDYFSCHDDSSDQFNGTPGANIDEVVSEWASSSNSSRHASDVSTTFSLARSLPGLGPQVSADSGLWSPSTTSSSEPPRVTPGALGKRQPGAEFRLTRPLGSPLKKPRLSSLPPAHDTSGKLPPTNPDLASPLFFSNSARGIRMNHLPGFMDPEAAASMMGSHEGHEGFTTLRLPKAVTTASPSRSSGTPGSWSSAEQSNPSRSPDGWPSSNIGQLLHGIGVVELLEQDERPTFMIDLNESANFGPGSLRIIYANSALKASKDLLERLQTETSAEGHNTEFAHFKSWAVTLVRDRTSRDSTTAPSPTWAGMNWVSSTLRRRFRVIRGNSQALESRTPTPPSSTNPPPPWAHSGPWTGREAGPPRDRGDYFGPGAEVHVRAHSEPRSRAGSVADTVVQSVDDMVLVTPPPLMSAPLPQLQTIFDWTRIPLDDPNLGPHHQFARSVDWGSTSLGPVETWPNDLRIMSNMIMGSPHPAALYWGPEFVAIYNEAYITLAGQKHPHLMGSRYKDAWSEIWDDLEPVFDAAWNDGRATMKHDDLLFITRHGFLEETFFNWAIIPLVGSDGTVVALYNPAFENTRRKISERRMLTLREVGVKTSQARDVKGFWKQLQRGLEYNEFDVPFALIYSVSEDSESDIGSMASGSLNHPPLISLEGSIGVPEGHPCAVPSINLRSCDEGFAHYMLESMADPDTPIILSLEDGTFPVDLIQGLEWKGFRDPCTTIVVFPVHPTTSGDAVVGFIVLGINPRRHYDDNYKLFVNLLSRQLATSMASVVLFEEEIKRGQRAARLAALDRQELSMQLHLRTQEAVKSEYRFTRMAEFGPVGLFIADGQGQITFGNESIYRISGNERSTSGPDSWMHTIRDEDRPGVEEVWRKLLEDKVAVTHEFRFRGSKRLIDGHSVDIWALMSAYPEKDESGELKSVFGCLTDISQQKWAEDFQKQRRHEAVELKRQQENFIDITSHEMRNPLSAILQCADEISSSLNEFKRGEGPVEHTLGELNLLVESCVEAANTISLCASHQKRIVDDILTLSKLDSNLLLVTPVDVQPIMVVQNVLRMFEAELQSNDITGEFIVEDSYRALELDWVKLDPSRLRQVLINLMTNAIKFTQGRPTRSIVIRLGASREVEKESGLSYIPPRHPDQGDLTDEPDWADGEKIHLHLAVTDTGPGLDDDEKKILFQRFSQTSPRTHVQYGGSGLGLFICRILTELQGGQIGVLSKKGEGSTFAFYIKSRKSDNPQVDLSAAAPTPQPTPPRQIQQTNAPPPQTEQPAPKPGPITAVLDGPALAGPLPKPARDPPNNSSLMDILIVEDNLVNQKVLQRQLQRSGKNTRVANHGGEALIELSKSRFWNKIAAAEENEHPPPPQRQDSEILPDGYDEDGKMADGEKQEEADGEESNRNISVILMDLEMPVMDGMSCTREIRRLERKGVLTGHVPIIAVTAYARPEQIENAKAAGVDDVISKPFRLQELLPKIEELVAKYKTLSCEA